MEYLPPYLSYSEMGILDVPAFALNVAELEEFEN